MDEARARQLLAAERRRIEETLSGLEAAAGDELSHVDQHPADDGSELFERERDSGMIDRLRAELAAVDRAEQRLATGTYGRSIESGEQIPDERLEAFPMAERTVEEQARLDRGR